MVESVYCMRCRKATSFKEAPIKVEYKTSRGVKYGLVGFCVEGHKVSKMTKKE